MGQGVRRGSCQKLQARHDQLLACNMYRQNPRCMSVESLGGDLAASAHVLEYVF